MKECNICFEVKPLSEFYSQNKKSKKRGDYIYYHPECKQCSVNRTVKWQEDNHERYLELCRKRNNKPAYNARIRLAVAAYQRDGKQLLWQQNNKDKLKGYQEDRKHMLHEISAKEWRVCKKFFDHSCAYCEISELEHYELFNEQLHKDHVDPLGSNKIDNCIPACKRCNPSKSETEIETWFKSRKDIFSEEKLSKIYYWLENYIEILKDNIK